MGDVNVAALPSGYPEHLSGPLTWQGEYYEANRHEYIEILDANDVEELKTAAKAFLGRGRLIQVVRVLDAYFV